MENLIMPRRFAISRSVTSAGFIDGLLAGKLVRRFLLLGGVLLGHSFIGNVATADEIPTLEARLSKLGYTQGEPLKSINDYHVDGWNYIDDKHVMIYTGVSRRALLTLLSDCLELSSVERISFSTTVNKVTKFDKIVVHGASGMRRDCQISEIHQLDSTKAKTP
jgi:hypothetical protein